MDWPDHEDGGIMHREVGAYPPNAWGLHGVHGNLWEHCLDGWVGDFYGRSPEVDPVAPREGAPAHVIRGGGFTAAADGTRSARRGRAADSFADNDLGLRPARVISE